MAVHTEKQASLQDYEQDAMPWLWWILASMLGGVIIGVFSRPEDFLMHLVVRGFIVGAVQWLIVRHYLGHRVHHQGLWWIVATGAGMVLSTMLLLLPPLDNALAGLYTTLYQQFGLWEVFWINLVQEGMVWGLVGVFQWLMLRRWIGAGLWIGLSLLGGALMGATVAAACYAACDVRMGTFNIGVIASDAAAWGVYGVVTGYGFGQAIRVAAEDIEK